MLFVLVDGWSLIMGSMTASFVDALGSDMDVSQVIELGRESLLIAVMVATPLLGVALAVGLLIGIIQAATSIQEMTLSFIRNLALWF